MTFRSDAEAWRLRREALAEEVRDLRQELERARAQADRAELLAERLLSRERELAALRGRSGRSGPLGILAVMVILGVASAAASGLRPRAEPPRPVPWAPLGQATARAASMTPELLFEAVPISPASRRGGCALSIAFGLPEAPHRSVDATLTLRCPSSGEVTRRPATCLVGAEGLPARCRWADGGASSGANSGANGGEEGFTWPRGDDAHLTWGEGFALRDGHVAFASTETARGPAP